MSAEPPFGRARMFTDDPREVLNSLPPEARALWMSPRRRAQVLGDIVAALEMEHRRGDLPHAVAVMDDALVAGLVALGVPRGPLNGPVRLEPRPAGHSAIRRADCTLVISSTYLLQQHRVYHRVDAVVRTWVHESVHARQPYATDFLYEFEPWEGYEEGLADALANLLCREWARMDTGFTDYLPYTHVYQALAAVLDLSLWQLLYALWEFPVGRVRVHFGEVVGARVRELTGQPFSPEQSQVLITVADQLFASGRMRDDVPDSTLRALWRSALP